MQDAFPKAVESSHVRAQDYGVVIRSRVDFQLSFSTQFLDADQVRAGQGVDIQLL